MTELSQGIGKKSLLKLMGLSAKGMPRVNLRHEHLPFFLCASHEQGSHVGEKSQVESNIELVCAALGVNGTRNFVITFDDTCFWPTYSLCYLPAPTIVGGSGDHSLLNVEDEDKVDMAGLEKKFLAQSCISYCVSRADSNHHVYDVRMVPRRLKDMKATNSLLELGLMWQAACRANGDLPPLAQSCDNHQSQVVHNLMFLGGMKEEMEDYPFLF